MPPFRLGFYATVLALGAACVLLVACNDSPSDVGTSLISGTDTILSVNSAESPLITSVEISSVREPIINSTYVLLGGTQEDVARVFIEFINYPRVAASDSFEVEEAHLLMYPQDYVYGDTTDKSVAFSVYELQRQWSANATWDSIWTSSNTTDYYSTASIPVTTYNEAVTSPPDSAVRIPFPTAIVKRWLVDANDSAASKLIFGIVLHPSESSRSVRQFRNLINVNQIMRLRVVTKRILGESKLDTLLLESVVACFVNTPEAKPGELLVQGARIHQSKLSINLSTIPPSALIIGGSLSVSLDPTGTTSGKFGRDEVIALRYLPPTGSIIEIPTRIDANGTYTFNGIGPLLQLIHRNGDSAELIVKPTGVYDFWRMNRLRLYGADADVSLRPRVSASYIIPRAFTK